VFDISTAGLGVGFPGTSANTNDKAGLRDPPYELSASTLTLILSPV